MRTATPHKRLRDYAVGEIVTLEGGIGPLYIGRVVDARAHLWRKVEMMDKGYLPVVEACVGHRVMDERKMT